jgi:phospholipase C
MSRARSGRLVIVGAAGLVAAVVAGSSAARAAKPEGMERLQHIVVVFLENRSFDNVFGLFPTADGLLNAGPAATQVNEDGKAYDTLPAVINTSVKPPAVDKRFPQDLPNRPFLIDAYVPIDQKTGDLVHRWYQEQAQIDGGRMDRFALVSDAKGLAMGFSDASGTALWRYAQEFTLADNFFHAAFGGSFLNHFWLICACTPRYENAPSSLIAKVDAQGRMVKDGAITPEGYAVNTMQPAYMPHSAKFTDPSLLLPPQDMPTIGDRLSDKGVSWAWYSGGWDDAIAGRPDPIFQFHHQPFAYFKQFGDGTEAKAQHLKDEKDLTAALDNGTLPAVVFYKPIGALNEHPGYANLVDGDRHLEQLVEKIRGQPSLWNQTAIIVTYDENGGLWDHVAPPEIDQWGPGTRIPAVIISPFAKRGFVDHTVYDTTSIMKLIETRFELRPVAERDAKANDLTNAFQF